LAVAKLREIISVSKQERHKFDIERFDLKYLHDIEVKEKCQIEISKRFADLEGLDESPDISNAWESIRERNNTSGKDNLGYRKVKHYKPWLDDECLKLIDQRKEAKLFWLQNSNKFIGDNLQKYKT
jgi:hypothetical protein